MIMISKRYINDGNSELNLSDLQKNQIQIINEKIKSGIYQFENVSCALCGCESHLQIAEKDRYGLKCSTVICKDCGLVFLNPRMTQRSYNIFYSEVYRKLYLDLLRPDFSFFLDEQYKRASKIYDYLKNEKVLLKQNPIVLEIGCGAGGILQYFKDRGYIVKGLDLDDEYVNFGRINYGLDLTIGTIRDIKLENKPDLILYVHVFEHILDLEDELIKLKEMCSEHTLIYVEVPGIKVTHSDKRLNYLLHIQNAHTYSFSKKTLSKIFAKHGFKLIKGDETIRSIFIYTGDVSLGTFKSDFPYVLKYLKSIELLRTLSPLYLLLSKLYSKVKSFCKRITNLTHH